MAVVFIFADGLGLAPAGPDNPLAAAAMPAVRRLLGGPLTLESLQAGPRALLRAIDATLGVAGLPQSGTGHTALLGGFNAAAAHGHHQPSFPPVALRPRLAADSLFHRVAAGGGTPAFANVFGPNYWRALESGRLRPTAAAIAAQGAGVRLRTIEDLLAGRAVCWDVTGAALREREPEVPPTTPAQAGQALADLARGHELVYFETYLPDLAAHGRMAASLPEALGVLDSLIGETLAALGPRDTLLLTSDHGNAESVAARSHTRNPVPLLAAGPDALAFAGVESIADVAAAAAAAALRTHE